MTKVINFIGGSGCGKSLMSALVFAELKMKHLSVEYIQEYSKQLVWANNMDLLNDQYHVSIKQYNRIKMMEDKVDYIINFIYITYINFIIIYSDRLLIIKC